MNRKFGFFIILITMGSGPLQTCGARGDTVGELEGPAKMNLLAVVEGDCDPLV